ncbi:MAG: hypothetical protein M0Z42_15505 [Actinomycetota bacterium]|nr:hypothetical protein [Actinomycetota bacterium]
MLFGVRIAFTNTSTRATPTTALLMASPERTCAGARAPPSGGSILDDDTFNHPKLAERYTGLGVNVRAHHRRSLLGSYVTSP